MAFGKEGGSTKGKKEGKGECRRWGEGGAHKCKKEKFLGNWGSVRLDEGGQSKKKSTCFDCFGIAKAAIATIKPSNTYLTKRLINSGKSTSPLIFI